ncbi:MAG: M20/M25/M40 family metallo-hydrolase [Clostridia bacterium]|nr:M20/M25/M40 family metallo-hydrolase [Clostridia bacterium]
MENIKRILKELLQIYSVSGNEKMGKDAVLSLVRDVFDEVKIDNMGTYILVKKSNKKNAKRLLIDAHFDTVGLMVTSIKKGGFLKVVNIGGLDTRVLPATEVVVHGKRDIYGLITSTPPHLREESSKNPKIEDLMVDTGYEKEELEKIVSVGDFISYKQQIDFISGDYVTASSLDDKACLTAVIEAASKMDKEMLQYDVYVTASAQEETGKAGVARVAFDINPDIAIITDVNFARTEKEEDFETIECKGGASVDISALTDRRLTRNIINLLKEKGIKHQLVCEPGRTCTNNDPVSISGYGIRTALMSIPLKSMHTPSETVNLQDIKSLADILVAVSYEENL